MVLLKFIKLLEASEALSKALQRFRRAPVVTRFYRDSMNIGSQGLQLKYGIIFKIVSFASMMMDCSFRVRVIM